MKMLFSGYMSFLSRRETVMWLGAQFLVLALFSYLLTNVGPLLAWFFLLSADYGRFCGAHDPRTPSLRLVEFVTSQVPAVFSWAVVVMFVVALGWRLFFTGEALFLTPFGGIFLLMLLVVFYYFGRYNGIVYGHAAVNR